MEGGIKLKTLNPQGNSNIITKLFFGWTVKLFYKASTKVLEVSDLYRVLNCDKSERLGNDFEIKWKEELERAKSIEARPSLLRVISRLFLLRYMVYGIFVFIEFTFVRACQPNILAYLIILFGHPDGEDTRNKMYISGALLVTAAWLFITIWHHSSLGHASIGMRIRVGVSSLIYRKILKLNKSSLVRTGVGEVINLLSNDVGRFDFVLNSLHTIWVMPIQAFFMTYLIWQDIGISCLVGVITMAVLVIPVQGYLGKVISRLRLQVAEKTDIRSKLMSAIISGIQVIKMYAWEKPFEELVKLTRHNEINKLRKVAYIRAIYLSCLIFLDRFCLFITLISYVFLGNYISADKVFALFQFFNILQFTMAYYFPVAISIGAETLVTLRRVEDFLLLEEIHTTPQIVESETKLILKDVTASWTIEVPILKNINLYVPSGCLCAIIGPVGAGKSSLLQLFLTELIPVIGTVEVAGKISYSSQDPWLFPSTIRNNILFGEDLDSVRYSSTVNVCALTKDFEQLPQGEMTVVGDRGASLSGGQRARINLARAVYRQADIYLFDDPLSAVDTHVGKHLFEKCICKYLEGKTRVLVTHQLQYLKMADWIVVINKGKIEANGTFEELSNSNLDFTKMLIAAEEEDEKEDQYEIDKEGFTDSINSLSSTICLETRAENINPFKEYVKASGTVCSVIWFVLVFVTGQVLCTSADFWVTFWAQTEDARHLNAKPRDSVLYDIKLLPGENLTNETNFYETFETRLNMMDWFGTESFINWFTKYENIIKVYVGIIVGTIFFSMLRSLLFFNGAMNASKNIHNNMFDSILKVSMRFFDTNSSGRILNRFSKDIGAIDDILPIVLLETLQIFLVLIGILLSVMLTNLKTIVVIVVLGILFIKVGIWYIKSATNFKHLEGVTKSPVFSHVDASLNGLTTIRAFHAEDKLIDEFDNHQDVHTSAWLSIITCIHSFGLWLDTICTTFLACVTFIFIIEHQYTRIEGSIAGLAISQSMTLTVTLQHGIRQISEVINQFTSVERLIQYTRLEKEESTNILKAGITPPGWPDQGKIQFKDLSLQYDESAPRVLTNLNFLIQPGEKVGIVGRTGAGKSSLISALFRLAPLKGSIIIDEIDTQEIILYELRKNISIIPQQPVLYSASLRFNLDPFKEFDDDKLWMVLEEVELKNIVDSLDFIVSESGNNFSLGQRQLICLARAILRNNKILVLDEATANVDPKTDALIQATIRRKFSDCTVLTIAHRLNTIMDSDKVIVMDTGRAVQFDHPHLLLQNTEGQFYQMVAQTGPSMTLQLKDTAFEAYQTKYKRYAIK